MGDRFEKVVEYEPVILNGKTTLIFGLIMMLPFINIFFAVVLVIIALQGRKVSFRKIKQGENQNE